MGYTDVDQLAINTIRVLAVGCCPSSLNKKNPAPANSEGRVVSRSAPPWASAKMVFFRAHHGLAVAHWNEDNKKNEHLLTIPLL